MSWGDVSVVALNTPIDVDTGMEGTIVCGESGLEGT